MKADRDRYDPGYPRKPDWESILRGDAEFEIMMGVSRLMTYARELCNKYTKMEGNETTKRFAQEKVDWLAARLCACLSSLVKDETK